MALTSTQTRDIDSPAGVITLHTSNQTEVLAAQLAELLAKPSGGILQPETVLVQGRGMATWLSMQLATEHGICANIEFSYPRAFIWRIFRAFLGEPKIETAELTEARLFWLILKELPALLSQPEFTSVKRYLSRDDLGLRRFQLAARIALNFDQYLIYRPDLIRIWEDGHDDGAGERNQWQPVLWRQLKTHIAGHIASLEREFLRSMAESRQSPISGSEAEAAAPMPKRLSLFGVTTLPPLFVRLLTSLAPTTELHLFAFEACERPHSLALLRSLRKQSEEFRAVLEQSAEEADVGLRIRAHLKRPSGTGALGTIQRMLFGPDDAATPNTAQPGGKKGSEPGQSGQQLTLLGPSEYDQPATVSDPASPSEAARPSRVPLDTTDTSLSIHACHSALREVEVLKDQLLDVISDATSQVEAHEIIVMMPDVETYAPLIEAAFSRDRSSPHFIPYRISDRSARADNAVLDALSRILALVDGRLTATEVLDLLSLAAIHEHFEMTASDMEKVSGWVVASGIRWGKDGAHRRAHEQPEVEQNTWRNGLDRLLLGYAMPTNGEKVWHGILPYDEIEGQSAELLGKFVNYTDTLFECLAVLTGSYSMPQWQKRCETTLAKLILFDFDNANEHQRIQSTLAELTAEAAEATFEEEVPLKSLAALLEQRLDSEFSERGFLSHGVTFCAMLPMRTIPFRVVALLGMNDGAFPRGQRSVDFDLIAHGESGPRPGDHDRRKDDRQLFLEALMAAREKLIITYTGQSIRDNSERPPSVVVGQLLDTLALHYDPTTPYQGEASRVDKLAKEFITHHPLQAFSRAYFDNSNPRLFSFSGAYHKAAAHLIEKRESAPPFFRQPLLALAQQQPTPQRTFALRELVRFWEEPIRYLLEQRLQLFLSDNRTSVSDREPLELDPLDRYVVGDQMLRHRLSGLSTNESAELLLAQGALPPGAAATLSQEALDKAVAPIAALVKEHCQGEQNATLYIDRELDSSVRLGGELSDVWGETRVSYQFSRLQSKHLLRAWIHHLFFCWQTPSANSLVIGRAPNGDSFKQVRFGPVDNPEPILSELIALSDEGQLAPLLFAPRASHSYVTELQRLLAKEVPNAEELALRKAKKAYADAGGERSFGPHLQRVFGKAVPPFENITTTGPSFHDLAFKVYGPLLAHTIEEEK